LEQLGSGKPAERKNAVKNLSHFMDKPDVIDKMIETMKDGDDGVRNTAVFHVSEWYGFYRKELEKAEKALIKVVNEEKDKRTKGIAEQALKWGI